MKKADNIAKRMELARKGYGVSAACMGIICGFGENQWRLYEQKKSTPSKSNQNLICMVVTPMGMHAVLKIIPGEAKKRIGKDFDKILEVVTNAINGIQYNLELVESRLNHDYFKQV